MAVGAKDLLNLSVLQRRDFLKIETNGATDRPIIDSVCLFMRNIKLQQTLLLLLCVKHQKLVIY